MGLERALLCLIVQLRQSGFARVLLPLLLRVGLLPFSLLFSAPSLGLALSQLPLDTGNLACLCSLFPVEVLLACG
ncbi:hypothetical protein ACQPXS_21485 [Streptomyces sp. CA-142005]|uniref:hypothetical protein n=1 Tax=Streptomyces sp. CA-142005 TaxID=3240052 RepID=UPI003D9424A8